MRVWRRYVIVSTRGTRGTLLQRLLSFTTAHRRAPNGLVESALRRYHIDLRLLMRRNRGARSPVLTPAPPLPPAPLL